jgi:hypothetical protein
VRLQMQPLSNRQRNQQPKNLRHSFVLRHVIHRAFLMLSSS